MSLMTTISRCPISKPTSRSSLGSLCNPWNNSAYISATRWGVSFIPSREGSSPIASIISRTALLILTSSILPLLFLSPPQSFFHGFYIGGKLNYLRGLFQSCFGVFQPVARHYSYDSFFREFLSLLG